MPKLTSIYVCQQCGFRSSQYLGKCPQCDSWNSLVEEIEKGTGDRVQGVVKKANIAKVVNLADIKRRDFDRLRTGIEEFDRVLGGGIVRGSIVLVAGEPGIGKSTLLTQLALNINSSVIPARFAKRANAGIQLSKHSEDDSLRLLKTSAQKKLLDPRSSSPSLRAEGLRGDDGSRVLYVAGEESAQQIKLRVDRMKQGVNLAILNEVDIDLIVGAIEQIKPSLVIVDSVQTLETQDLNGVAGSVGQVRECAHRLQKIAKLYHIPIFLVGHITKEGVVAGPKTLEHVVDTVLSLEGDPTSQFRILRSTKNRFGSTDEVGIFEMTDLGMIEVKNPSRLFLDQKVKAPGSCVVAILTGIRPLLVEIQALVIRTNLPIPRRTGSGIDNNKLQLLVAVLQKRLGLPLLSSDIFVNVTGGLKITEPASDLGICLAIASSLKDTSLKDQTVVIGEVGLLGEIRAVRNMDKRIEEAKKLGFKNFISSENARSLTAAVKLAF